MSKKNLNLWEEIREVPENAQKTIGGGRLKGMTDINPMWRIKTLTEQFGICGFGWYYEIKDKWIENVLDSNEVTANVEIALYVKQGDEWSKPIQGVGGSMLAANERSGLYVNDESFKMALTDAISVACKSLGMGADIYWAKDNTKYNDSKRAEPEKGSTKKATEKQIGLLKAKMTPEQVDWAKKKYEVEKLEDITIQQASTLIETLKQREEA